MIGRESIPVGSPSRNRFFFAVRPLTEAEEGAFFSGLGLPSGVGFDPPKVLFDYKPPGAERTTLEGVAITREEKGGYHALTTPTVDGLHLCRGRGVTEANEPAAATPDWTFLATRTF